MSAITSADVTNIKTWRQSIPGGTLLWRLLDIALASQGGTANDIPASALGFKIIYTAQSCGLVGASADLHCVPVVVEDDQEGILTINIEDSTDNTRSDPANPPVDGDLRVLVCGLESN